LYGCGEKEKEMIDVRRRERRRIGIFDEHFDHWLFLNESWTTQIFPCPLLPPSVQMRDKYRDVEEGKDNEHE
jgi:hypothetical protein